MVTYVAHHPLWMFPPRNLATGVNPRSSLYRSKPGGKIVNNEVDKCNHFSRMSHIFCHIYSLLSKSLTVLCTSHRSHAPYWFNGPYEPHDTTCPDKLKVHNCLLNLIDLISLLIFEEIPRYFLQILAISYWSLDKCNRNRFTHVYLTMDGSVCQQLVLLTMGVGAWGGFNPSLRKKQFSPNFTYVSDYIIDQLFKWMPSISFYSRTKLSLNE